MTKLFYFCDETSFHDPWMAVGGVAIRADHINEIRDKIAAINEECHVTSEVKWETAKPRRKNIHQAYVDYLFDLTKANRAHFHVRFAPFDQYDHNLSGRNARLDTVGKMHYQLILHRALRYYGDDHELHIYPDNGVCTEKLPTMRDYLNFEHSKKPIRHIECRDSAQEPILQLLDVSLGALASYKNLRHEEPNASKIKTELAASALKRTGLASLDRSTGLSAREFNLWIVTPKWKKGSQRN